MSVLFQVEALELITEKAEPDRRTFRKGLNILIGDPGSGKSTIIELIRFALGLKAQKTPVVERYVQQVTVDIVAGDHRLGLTRVVRTPGTVSVVDLESREAFGEYPVAPDDDEVGIGTALLEWLGIPSNIGVTVQNRRKVVTFEHVWEYMHVPQFEIDHSIARHDVSSHTSRRKRVFELLFGLVDERLSNLEREVEVAKDTRRESKAHLRGVKALTERTALPPRDDLESELSEAERRRQRLRGADEMLRSSLGAHDDRIVALRGLLTAIRNTMTKTGEALDRLEETQRQRRTRSEELEAALARLDRVRTANVLLSPIEFSQCPRCLQSLSEHRAHPGACRLCLQEVLEEENPRPGSGTQKYDGDPERLPIAIPGESTAQESQLSDQREEIRMLLLQGEQEKESLHEYRGEILQELRDLEMELEILTSRLGFPGSEELARVAEQLTGAEAEIERINSLISLDDHAQSFTTENEVAKRRVEEVQEELDQHQEHLSSTSRTLFEDLSDFYSDLLVNFAAPNVRESFIYSRDFLPYIDGKSFDTVSISGGNRAPFIVGYWLALQLKALTNSQYPFPGFLILDSPQKSLGPLQTLSSNMYRQIQEMAEQRAETFQIFALDTNLPKNFVPSEGPIKLSYTDPGIRNIRHPGPGTFPTAGGAPVEDTDTE